ncbi:exported protein of unknown function [Candidatus Hydrogenisulfobacillus filiaventi]|uniref:Uncharacterized protein n=1 Tax=Candidatus Hydrogenisulfobacillus filiaventi TaxID=2707344 RepID=A0A6F8ZIT3_9FIRM|nr:exported protein of unknown function [Candidatus Hydrogenisulfobacillus filiaventi]
MGRPRSASRRMSRLSSVSLTAAENDSHCPPSVRCQISRRRSRVCASTRMAATQYGRRPAGRGSGSAGDPSSSSASASRDRITRGSLVSGSNSTPSGTRRVRSRSGKPRDPQTSPKDPTRRASSRPERSPPADPSVVDPAISVLDGRTTWRLTRRNRRSASCLGTPMPRSRSMIAAWMDCASVPSSRATSRSHRAASCRSRSRRMRWPLCHCRSHCRACALTRYARRRRLIRSTCSRHHCFAMLRIQGLGSVRRRCRSHDGRSEPPSAPHLHIPPGPNSGPASAPPAWTCGLADNRRRDHDAAVQPPRSRCRGSRDRIGEASRVRTRDAALALARAFREPVLRARFPAS